MSNYYLCPKCFAISLRDTEKQKIKSFCDETGQSAFMTRIDSADKLAVKFREKYLKNLVDFSSFNWRDKVFLEMAFEQGAKVIFNSLRKREEITIL
jgi:acetyl-CoA carboxylase beta subunit